MLVALESLFASLLVQSATAVLTLVPLKDKYPDAVCMDGSSSGYYWKPAASEEGESTWIVFLQAGGWCWDSESCEKRCEGSPGLCSSAGWESEMNETGLFSHDIGSYHLSLRTANKVFVRYCTSDAHMGNAESFGHQFRGARVVQAVLSDLVTRRGLGSDEHGGRQLLLFGGGSAGARGAMVHLDYVPSMIGEASQNVDLVGFLDSPLWLDLRPLNDSFFEGFANQTHHMYDFANVTHLGEKCAVTFSESPWSCMLGEYRMHFVKSRYFLIAAKHDSFQLYYDTGHNETWTDDQLVYAAQFAKRTAELMRTLASMRHAVYSPSCLSHAESLNENAFFNHTTEDGASVRDAVQEFLNLESSTSDDISKRTFQWVDQCDDLDCGSGCHGGDATKGSPEHDIEHDAANGSGSDGEVRGFEGDIPGPDDDILLSGARGFFVSRGMAMGIIVIVLLLDQALP